MFCIRLGEQNFNKLFLLKRTYFKAQLPINDSEIYVHFACEREKNILV